MNTNRSSRRPQRGRRRVLRTASPWLLIVGLAVPLGLRSDVSAVESSYPVVVTGTSPEWSASALATGSDGEDIRTHACAVTTDAKVRCWGYGYFGQIGNNTALIERNAYAANVPLSTSAGASPAARVSQANGPTIAHAGSHSCVIVDTATNTGSVQCWGYNATGQLGDGSVTQRNTPVVVTKADTTVLTGATAVATSSWGPDFTFSHSCAVVGGGVYCWGHDLQGQLGDGTIGPSVNSRAVLAVPLGSGAVSVALGQLFSCALFDDGTVKCWGEAALGKLGTGNTSTNSPTPNFVKGIGTATKLTGVTSITAGMHHACALTLGGVACWGNNAYGEVGDSSTTQRNTPVFVTGIGPSSGVTSIAATGRSTCAVRDGGVRCWGRNDLGQVGDGTTTSPRTSPVGVVQPGETASSANLLTGISSATHGALGASTFSMCALDATGSPMCWGYNGYGQLGDGTATNRSTPGRVAGTAPAEFTPIGVGVSARGDASSAHVCAPTSTGTIKCWGQGSLGQLGVGTTTASNPTPLSVTLSTAAGAAPVVPSTGTTGSLVTRSGNHTCTIFNATGITGGVQCWGRNTYGQLGDGTTTARTVPAPVKLSAAPGAWLTGATAVEAGAFDNDFAATCAVVDGGVKCWGANAVGSLGVGNTTASSYPVQPIPAGSGVIDVSIGYRHTCALFSSGTVKCWGANAAGSNGIGNTTANRLTPETVVGVGGTGTLSGVTSMSAGTDHSCAVANGGVVCWGFGTNGQLGDNSVVSKSSPVQVSGLPAGSGATSVSAGNRNSCAVVNGGVRCWGSNTGGVLGDGSTTQRTTPVTVRAPERSTTATLGNVATSAFNAVSVGGYTACARQATGALVCWGREDNGELGHGTNPRSLQVAPLGNAVPGVAFPTAPQATVRANGNAVSGRAMQVAIVPGTGASGATLTCTSLTATSASSGVASWPGCSINLEGTGYQLRITDSVTGDTAVTPPFDVRATGVGVTCDLVSVSTGNPATCTVTVTDLRAGGTPPLGTVSLSVDGSVDVFTNGVPSVPCTLAAATTTSSTCVMKAISRAAALKLLAATYTPSSTHSAATGTSWVNVLESTSPTMFFENQLGGASVPRPLQLGEEFTVRGYNWPTGSTVRWGLFATNFPSSAGFSPSNGQVDADGSWTWLTSVPTDHPVGTFQVRYFAANGVPASQTDTSIIWLGPSINATVVGS